MKPYIKLLSVNLGLPRSVHINGRDVMTGIYKTPRPGKTWLGRNSLAGDGQADLSVHGGEFQAAYCYPVEHYAHWAQRLSLTEMPHGLFGENFTVSGLLETEVHLGDMLQIGQAVVEVTMPRIPCFKFGHRIGHPGILDEFLHSGRSGFYLKVHTPGEVGAGDGIAVLQRDARAISIRTALGLQKLQEGDAALLQQALQVPTLAPLLRQAYQQRLMQMTDAAV